MSAYETLDIYVAGFLEYSGFTLTLKQNNRGRIVFSTLLTDEVKDALAEYQTAHVQAKPFVNQIKELKRRMFSIKDAGEGLNYENSN